MLLTAPAPASDWVQRWSHLVPAAGTVLDVACGSGRHMAWFASRGHAVTGIDRDGAALQAAAAFGITVQADIESGPWPLAEHRFDAVVVTHYLWRPLLPRIVDAVAPGGVLLYETFAAGQETIGRPSRPEFLLRPGELLQAVQALRVVAYEDGFATVPDRFVQRIAAVRETASSTPLRHALTHS